jgi:hypothetical protein
MEFRRGGADRGLQPTIECDLDSSAFSEEMVLPSSSVIAAELPPWGWGRGVSLYRHPRTRIRT